MTNPQYTWEKTTPNIEVTHYFLADSIDPLFITKYKGQFTLHKLDNRQWVTWREATKIAGPFKKLKTAKMAYIVMRETIKNE